MPLNITPCNPYDARIGERELVRMPDGVSAFKVYFVSIVGRPHPERYEWDACPLTPGDFVDEFRQGNWEGVGFVTAFPHITKVFRFAPNSEILLHVAAYSTQTGDRIDLSRQEGYVEFACYAEALLAADEYRYWAEADEVEPYLQQFSSADQSTVRSHTKLAAYAAAKS
ncbi:MAG: hypothetical protein HN904_16170 [Victivallales bacterium]|nr:hypothetical protein [Victivallales bacterium]